MKLLSNEVAEVVITSGHIEETTVFLNENTWLLGIGIAVVIFGVSWIIGYLMSR